MHKLTFRLTCLVIIGHGRRLQTSSQQAASHVEHPEPLRQVPDRYPTDDPSPLEVLATLILARRSAAAFKPLSAGVHAPTVSGAKSRRSPSAQLMRAGLKERPGLSEDQVSSKKLKLHSDLQTKIGTAGVESSGKARKRVKLDVPLVKDNPTPPLADKVWTSTPKEIESTLQGMKVIELKGFAKSLGLKTGTLNKAELVTLCTEHITATVQTKHNEMQADTRREQVPEQAQIEAEASKGTPREQAPTPNVEVTPREQAPTSNKMDAARVEVVPAKVLKSTPEEIESTLQGMKLTDLKAFAKRLGLKPATLRKAELVALCTEQIAATVQTKRDQMQTGTVPKQAEIKADESAVSERGHTPTSNNMDVTNAKVTPMEQAPPTRISKPRLNSYLETPEPTPEKHNSPRFPTGPLRATRLDGLREANMEVLFLGTSSCQPTVGRATSCVALHAEKSYWLFDAGEGCQPRMTESQISPAKISKIFLTHLHGDHVFGLAGLLCFIGSSALELRDAMRASQNSNFESEPIDIYGPEGTRDFVRASLQLTYSVAAARYRVHELKEIPCDKRKYQNSMQTRSTFAEKPGGRDIYPDENGHYHLFQEGDLTVMAAPMKHTVPCVGYVVKEDEQKGHLCPEHCHQLISQNYDALKAEYKDPNRVFKTLKALQPGESFTFPDGSILRFEDIMEPDRPGRKIVIMGDTSSGSMISPLAQDADLLIHEATNALVWNEDFEKYGDEAGLERVTRSHGHSTPGMAGDFARRIGAKRLVLTHFSPRYFGDDSLRSMSQMWKIEDHARRSSNLTAPNDVIAAWDGMKLPVAMH